MTGTVDPCPHVCAACGSCPDCCPERHETTTEETGTMTEPHDTDTKITLGIDKQGNPVTMDRAAWIKMARGRDVIFIDDEIPAILDASSGHGKSDIIAAKLAEFVQQGRLNGDPRHDPHPIAEGDSCAACEVQAVKDAALLRHSMKRDHEAGVIWIVDTKTTPSNWTALLDQSAPDDQPTP